MRIEVDGLQAAIAVSDDERMLLTRGGAVEGAIGWDLCGFPLSLGRPYPDGARWRSGNTVHLGPTTEMAMHAKPPSDSSIAIGPAVAQRVRRLARREEVCMVPQPVPGEPGCFVVDATWGTIMPIELAPGVRTVGELEVIAHVEAGLPLIDTRLPKYLAGGTIPTARALPHTETAERLDEFDDRVDTVLFCNGPQCAATPDAIRTLLRAGHPAERLLYYRGGIHDWVTLGLPLEPAAEHEAPSGRRG